MSESALLWMVARYPNPAALARRSSSAARAGLVRLERAGLVRHAGGLYRLTRAGRSELELERALLGVLARSVAG
jgi:hypothetical protein